jgi:hypothetical protein
MLAGTYPSGTSSVIMRFCHGLAIHDHGLLSNHSDTKYFYIEGFHHAFVVHERLCTKLFESIQDLLPSAYKGLFLVYLNTLRFLYIHVFVQLLH